MFASLYIYSSKIPKYYNMVYILILFTKSVMRKLLTKMLTGIMHKRMH